MTAAIDISMTDFNRKEHWEKIYQTKSLNELSWYQPSPLTSLEFMNELDIAKDAKTIDIGGGDSFLVDNLIEKGYVNVSVLDISGKAIMRARKRLGDNANMINWIEADVAEFSPDTHYDFWHDRAAFHFLTDENEIRHYANTAYESINHGGHLLVGTFSTDGPTKCSGIEISQYSESSLAERFSKFQHLKTLMVDHITPSGGRQNFIFCLFQKA